VGAEKCSEVLENKEVVSCVCGSHIYIYIYIYNFILYVYIIYCEASYRFLLCLERAVPELAATCRN
jgi:hypothetical protein